MQTTNPPGAPGPRRAWLAQVLALLAAPAGAGAMPADAAPGLRFPRDFGAHRDFRTEWWYLTGHARQGSRTLGFQLTFFRSRVPGAQSISSRLAARQLVFAHAAVSDIAGGRLLHDQRMARWSGLPAAQDGFGQAFAADGDTDVRLGRDDAAGSADGGLDEAWTLVRHREGYRARARCRDFALELDLLARQPLLLQGQGGLSQKGPRPEHNSHYYSVPQLQVQGSITVAGRRMQLTPGPPADNAAWLDHEWSREIMPPGAVGWDWMGINGFDGFAFTAFRLRRPDGTALWAGGSWRGPAAAETRVFAAADVMFEPLRHWTSPRTGVTYPVAWRIRTPAGRFELRALIADQELDSRASTGAIYWEGLSELYDEVGRAVGRGYLELTGYQAPLRL